MKAAILTQPLGHNYGGLMQAYALQFILRTHGLEVDIVDRQRGISPLRSGKHLLKRILGRPVQTSEHRAQVYQHLLQFKSNFLPMSPPITSEKMLRDHFEANRYDVVIVGSDQVWRPRYSPSLPNFYLNFLDDLNSTAKRLSYAASFGVDSWEYTYLQTIRCKKLLQKFDAVSVRESSAVAMCRHHFNIEAEWVLDPTLLLPHIDYSNLIPPTSPPPSHQGVFAYILDPDSKKWAAANSVSHALHAPLIAAIPPSATSTSIQELAHNGIYPPVEAWLKGIRDANFVITDSFHGCVFSIIFNKPFIALGNTGRGLSRFHSLLSLLDLEARLVHLEDGHKVPRERILAPIDWSAVNLKVQKERARSIRFVTSNIS